MSPNFLILYVDQPQRSASFYSQLLDKPVIDASETFALLPLDNGWMLGLWSRHTVEPAALNTGGGAEVCFALDSREAVDAYYQRWTSMGLTILQHPVRMDFGYTFVAQDPDGQRLRVFVVED